MLRKMFGALAVATVIPVIGGVGVALADPLPASVESLPPSTVPLPLPYEVNEGMLGGTTRLNGGVMYVSQNWFSHKQSFGTRSGFTSAFGIKSPRLQVRILDSRGGVIQEQNQSWGNTRHQEDITMNHHISRPAASACTTLWEGGHQLNTACEAIQ